MLFKKKDFPRQAQPVHEFMIRDGQLVRRDYYYYVPTGNGYRIWAPSGVKTKDKRQMEAVLAGRFWTLDPDPARVLQAFDSRSRENLIKARTDLETAENDRNELQDAIAHIQAGPDGVSIQVVDNN